MPLSLQKMSPAWAEDVVSWRYAAPYDTYDTPADQLPEIVTGDYLAILEDGELVGYACFGRHAWVPGGPEPTGEIVDIGLGIRPDRLSDRLGTRAGDLVLETLRMAGHERLRVSIMDWNERSLRLAVRLGFVETSFFISEHDGSRFVVLERELLA